MVCLGQRLLLKIFHTHLLACGVSRTCPMDGKLHGMASMAATTSTMLTTSSRGTAQPSSIVEL